MLTQTTCVKNQFKLTVFCPSYVIMSHKRFVFQLYFSLFYSFILCGSLACRSSHRRCAVKKCVLGNFTEFTGKHLFFIKKETQAQVFSCEFRKISKHTFFTEHLPATAPQHDNFLQKPIFIESSFCKRNVYVQLRFPFTKITVILCIKILCYLKLRDVLESEIIKVFYTFSRNELPNQYAVSLIQSMKSILVIYVTIY